ncbi:hypothetical protein BCY91_13305 [Pelobium manganitolerans]|uniref:RES domain-containing protein n=1 Tax=Pelobium manganitolerans TaxID=1842495 RepID=A0A419SAT7_9SPHI|nr:RES family NAD+ phosphorylase [Pelobium manganitolerans]RKD19571.1 hypothetical protein BCY91_13305 [Pelobium manganitolerans]
MQVYRISQTKFASTLHAPGFAGRWNTENQKIIYTAGSASLACLEVLAHKTGAALSSGNFSMAVIEVPDEAIVKEIPLAVLNRINAAWFKVANYPITQSIGDKWLADVSTLLLKVPSAIVDREYNYLINPLHSSFSAIKILDVVPFNFDSRLKMDL